MKLSLNWIKEFVDLGGIDIQTICDRLSLATAEVEGYEQKGKDVAGVVVAQITSCEPNPNNPKQKILTVDDGKKQRQVMCAAPNCRTGMKVAYAGVGARLGDITLGVATVGGHESHGMNCSERELGVSNEHGGIVELPSAARIGAPLCEVMPDINDYIIEVDNKSLTNRPDLWGHYGFARELAAIFGRKLKPLPQAKMEEYDSLPAVPITIENKDACLAFGLVRVDNVTLKQTPMHVKTRLYYCGVSPHGFLVDMSNYIMLEVGRPNHTFDSRRVGKFSVGNIPQGTKFTTLHDQEITATPEMVFVKSDGKPVALAGIMGGKSSQIELDTTSTIIEFGTWNAANIRKTSQLLGIRSDSSARFEKSLDTESAAIGAARMVKLILGFDKGAKVASRWNHAVAKPTRGKTISVDKAYLERFCGITFFDYKQVKKNLAALGFSPTITKDTITVTVPPWRATKDVTLGADIIEEIVRMYGYDNIPPAPPRVALRPMRQLPHRLAQARIKDMLSAKWGMSEVHTYIWNDSQVMKKLKIETPSAIRIVNSCAKDSDQVRAEISPSLLHVAHKNHVRDDVAVFEIGRTFTDVEKTHLGVCYASRNTSNEDLYKRLAGVMRDILGSEGANVRFELGSATQKYLHPKNNVRVLVNGEVRGFVGIVHPTVAREIGARMNIAVGEVVLDGLFDVAREDNEPKRVSKFPISTLDFTFVTDKPYGELERAFDDYSNSLVFGWTLKYVYAEPDGTHSYTLAFTVGSMERTLTAEDLQGVLNSVVAHAKNKGFSLK